MSLYQFMRDTGAPEGTWWDLLCLMASWFLRKFTYWDNGKENGNYNSILGLYRDNGKENGSY